MSQLYFKYKALTFDANGDLDNNALQQVIEPITKSYYYLPTRKVK
jgi:hypothetical protein